ncbi:Aste57867_13329 [Aphanomyces stellatus]|uniref:Aste57867_13329 protein n=1 Tax=Aphanomyces stellatus TaxID=120398 RepID=A0A485K7N2_9STRA|nr:hypothetical protein As57867_013280 [Aphanomyces stellatus]KAF0708969.1 hypothetical protein As57867_006128 [Aphanomyces stellatus]KAF0708970.1 hypothetical protein As57867_006129 [Aphanomyces stellatus]KAF0717901.1 hypothetical protein As57867_002024 [Aphanomyces stellatus]VFT79231.1 Aste57867_2027 [Aphanomyces stellatus]
MLSPFLNSFILGALVLASRVSALNSTSTLQEFEDKYGVNRSTVQNLTTIDENSIEAANSIQDLTFDTAFAVGTWALDKLIQIFGGSTKPEDPIRVAFHETLAIDAGQGCCWDDPISHVWKCHCRIRRGTLFHQDYTPGVYWVTQHERQAWSSDYTVLDKNEFHANDRAPAWVRFDIPAGTCLRYLAVDWPEKYNLGPDHPLKIVIGKDGIWWKLKDNGWTAGFRDCEMVGSKYAGIYTDHLVNMYFNADVFWCPKDDMQCVMNNMHF